MEANGKNDPIFAKKRAIFGRWKAINLVPLILIMAAGSAQSAESTANIHDGVLLYGYDPVSYFNAPSPQKGKPDIFAEVEGVKYLFANDQNRKDFVQEPKKFRPAYEGWCATAVAKGIKYDIDPTNFKITQGRLFLFAKGFFIGNAKNEWLKDEAGETKRADDNWPKVRLSKE